MSESKRENFKEEVSQKRLWCGRLVYVKFACKLIFSLNGSSPHPNMVQGTGDQHKVLQFSPFAHRGAVWIYPQKPNLDKLNYSHFVLCHKPITSKMSSR